jgi:Flp pilus assembly protein TadB
MTTSLDAVGAAAATSLAVAVLATGLTNRHPRPRVPVIAAARRRVLPLRLARGVPQPGPDDVADWCELVARSLRSGSSLTAAVTADAATESSMATVVEPVVRHITRGEPLVVALDGSGVDAVSPAGLAFTVLRSCARFGGPAAIPLERAAATLRVRAAVAAEQRAQSAQAQLSARVLTLVPIVLLGLLVLTDANVRSALGTPAGIVVVILGGLLNVAGALWMRRIIGRPK